MDYSTDYLQDDRAKEFEVLSNLLIPNETISLVTDTKDGFVVLTNRRLVGLKEKGKFYPVYLAVPLDCLYSLSKKDDTKWELNGIKTDTEGNFESKKKGEEVQYSLESIKLEMSKKGVVTTFQKSMEDLSNRIEKIREEARSPNSSPVSDNSYVEELCGFVPIDVQQSKFVQYVDPRSAHIIGTGGTFSVGEIQSHVYTHVQQQFILGEMIYTPRQEMVFKNDILLAIIYKWTNFNTYALAHMYLAEYDEKTGQRKLNKDGSVKAKEFRIKHCFYDRKKYMNMDWLWPQRNRPWVLADAFAYKTGKDPLANLPQTSNEKPRLYY